MKVFVARQPIMNRNNQVVAYELLYRDGAENVFPVGVEEQEATTRLINRTQLNSGLKSFTQGKPAFVNFGQQALINHLPELLPQKDVVIEILEDVEPNDEVYAACQIMFKRGCRFALDDFIYKKEWNRFLPLVKMIKFDIQKTPLDKLSPFISKLKRHGVENVRKIRILAERIETQEEYKQAVDLGFDYFQGFYFAKPAMLETTDATPEHVVLLTIYHEAMRREPNVLKLDKLFKQDPSLTFKLLNYINSGLFGNTNEINSIKTALLYLGQEKTRRFIALMVTACLKTQRSHFLIEASILRARFCELICLSVNRKLADSAFFIGLLSYLDVILDRPLAQILGQIAVSKDINHALVGEENNMSETAIQLRYMLDIVKIHETGSWRGLQKACAKLRIDENKIPQMHSDSIRWLEEFLNRANPDAKSEMVEVLEIND
jgi:EAL and modified HD-GYP domain-containing signal transduction protein